MNHVEQVKVALVGTGVVGRGWIRVFAAAGCPVRVYDRDPGQLEKNMAWVAASLAKDVADGFLTRDEAEAQKGRLTGHTNLAEALEGADYIQESTPENIEIKQAAFADMDREASPTAILASSSSSLDINDITRGLACASRSILAHPYNPPHVIPVVEVLPTEVTSPEVVERAMAFLEGVGQVPVLMKFYQKGFLGNRIQAAVVREAIHLVESGVAEVEAVDAVMCHGLGLRWALLGNFGVNHTNADGGLREYYRRYGEAFIAQMSSLDPTPPAFDEAMTERIAQGVDKMTGETPVAELCQWRDLLVRKIRQLKARSPRP